MASHDPSDRKLSASIAANTRWAKEPDRRAATAPGRRAALQRFEDEVDPERKLPPKERARRADNALKAHMQRIALRSVQARRARRRRTAPTSEQP